ncbi:exosortase H-associated membrane protein [Brevundimonas sp. DC300-4]|uniref:exosortase H-associated membrane protein n=1 Tax=Brevundimonas sp. DC300-4 TaxID=2804594 RepID=UPI003CF9C156
MSLTSRLAARTPEEAARRRFGLWAAASLVIFLPLWWMWGADGVAALLRPLVGAILGLFGLTGRIAVVEGGDWAIGTRLTQRGQAVDQLMEKENLRRLLLGFPLLAAFLIAPPRAPRPWRAVAISFVVLSVVFAISIAMTVWGGLAPMLNPDLAGAGMVITDRFDQAPLHPVAAQIVIVGRYVAQSIAPLLTALLLWAWLNPAGLQTLVAEIKD